MSVSAHLVWNPSPILITLGPIEIRWYGLFFATAFLFGFYLMERFCRLENKSDKNLDNILLVVVAGTIIGARLGHCLFYDPEYYLARPLEILKVWQGGLASHGAAVGILLSLYLYSRFKPEEIFTWLVDRLVICTAFAGFCIRLGNFFNSEIIGKASDVPWAVIFANVDQVARHPTQLYEAFSYLAIFFILYRYYRVKQYAPEAGRLFGLFASLVFGTRFFIEFLKEPQVGFESAWFLNMGQLLSIPLIAIGLWLYFRTKNATA